MIKTTNERFLSGSLENWLSIFVSSLSFELSQLFLYMWRFAFTGIAHDSVTYKEIEIWSWVAAVNQFKKWNVFASVSKVLTKCTAKSKEGVDNAG